MQMQKNSTKKILMFNSFIILLLFHIPGCSSNKAATNDNEGKESQETNWQLTFSEYTVLSNVTLERLNRDTLLIINHGEVAMVSVDSITELRFVKQSNFWKRVLVGAEIGAVVGAVLGALLINPSSSGETPYSKTEIQIAGKFLGAVFFGLEGGVVGSSVGAVADLVLAHDEVLDLSHTPIIVKSSIIQDFLATHGVSKLHK
jgi:gas vesicle protein